MRQARLTTRLLLLCVACAAALTGCHTLDEDGPRQPPGRLPVTPDEVGLNPAPTELETVQQWKSPPLDTSFWQTVIARIEGGYVLTYRVPLRWNADRGGRSQSGDGLVRAAAQKTTLTVEQMSLPVYAARLAEDSPLYSLRTRSGHLAYLTVREVSVAPSDPEVIGDRMYHTAVVEVAGHIAKLELYYDSDQRWRFEELANAVLGTIDVRELYAGAAAEAAARDD